MFILNWSLKKEVEKFATWNFTGIYFIFMALWKKFIFKKNLWFVFLSTNKSNIDLQLQYTSFMAVSCLKESCKIGRYLLMFSIKYQCKFGTNGRHDGGLQEALKFLAL